MAASGARGTMVGLRAGDQQTSGGGFSMGPVGAQTHHIPSSAALSGQVDLRTKPAAGPAEAAQTALRTLAGAGDHVTAAEPDTRGRREPCAVWELASLLVTSGGPACHPCSDPPPSQEITRRRQRGQ